MNWAKQKFTKSMTQNYYSLTKLLPPPAFTQTDLSRPRHPVL